MDYAMMLAFTTRALSAESRSTQMVTALHKPIWMCSSLLSSAQHCAFTPATELPVDRLRYSSQQQANSATVTATRMIIMVVLSVFTHLPVSFTTGLDLVPVSHVNNVQISILDIGAIVMMKTMVCATTENILLL
eukprot:4539271-Amphidinium_carterae.1